MILFSYKQGATGPSQILTLTSSVVYDITGAAVEFRYRKGSDPIEVISCPVTSVARKEVRLDIPSGMTDTLGTFECHVKAVLANGQTWYFPEVGFDQFTVTENF